MQNIDEKQRLVEEGSVEQTAPIRRRPSNGERLIRHIIPGVLLLLSACILFRKVFVYDHHYTPMKDIEYFDDEEDWVMVDDNSTSTRVALEAHIMSKCPDAKYCLEELVVPTMAQVSDKVDFTLSYIGQIDPHSDDVSCKHGPSECLGNMIQLCAAENYPDPKLYLGFANCMTSQYRRIPDQELVVGCAMEHGIDFGKINQCISQEGDGVELLRRSFERSRAKHVSTSCTVRVEEKVYCVRDGGKWSECPGGSEVSDLVSYIEDLYNKHNVA